jgi:hypothetical protein
VAFMLLRVRYERTIEIRGAKAVEGGAAGVAPRLEQAGTATDWCAQWAVAPRSRRRRRPTASRVTPPAMLSSSRPTSSALVGGWRPPATAVRPAPRVRQHADPSRHVDSGARGADGALAADDGDDLHPCDPRAQRGARISAEKQIERARPEARGPQVVRRLGQLPSVAQSLPFRAALQSPGALSRSRCWQPPRA